jgi:hypothetical protein
MTTGKLTLCSGLLLAVCLVSGCGGNNRFRAYGKVTYQGAPVKSGIISFIPEDGQASAGGSPINEGMYDIPVPPGLPAGTYKVSISVPKVGKGAVKEMDGPGTGGDTGESLPAKYNANTELRATIKPGASTEFNFDLK